MNRAEGQTFLACISLDLHIRASIGGLEPIAISKFLTCDQAFI